MSYNESNHKNYINPVRAPSGGSRCSKGSCCQSKITAIAAVINTKCRWYGRPYPNTQLTAGSAVVSSAPRRARHAYAIHPRRGGECFIWL